MSFFAKKLQQCARSLRRSLKNWCTDTCGNVMMMSALAMPVMLGMAGLAIEGGNWYQIQRKMQNAADAAAIAAAGNGTSAGYLAEARAVATTYGFTNGSNNTTVTASNAATCPAGGTNCYSVTISNNVALIFSKLVGYTGSTTVGGARAVALTSLAVATQTIVPREYCILALSTVGTPLQSNGAPNANLVGCNVMSDGNATCNGSDLNAPYGDAAGINNGCGDIPSSNVPPVGDSYSGLASNIPSDTCGNSYPQANIANNGKTVSSAGSATQWTGSYATTGNVQVCGDLVLSGDVTLTGSSVVIIIRNGELLTNDHKILTASGAAATIVFTGTSTTSGHIPNTQGTIDIKAPSTGVWAGAALYQDPNTTSGVDIDYSGNNPSTPVWAISGLVYMPHAAVSFSGAVNKAANGASCFAMVVNSLLINGNGTIFSQGSCTSTGLTRPTGSTPGRGQLVT
jgi:Flp pilus assembly protein TadG